MTSAAVAMLLGESVRHDSSDSELDTTLPNVMLDQEDLMMLDVGFSDEESDGNCTDCICSWLECILCYCSLFAAPTVWNKLPTGIRESNTLHTFKHRLKTGAVPWGPGGRPQ